MHCRNSGQSELAAALRSHWRTLRFVPLRCSPARPRSFASEGWRACTEAQLATHSLQRCDVDDNRASAVPCGRIARVAAALRSRRDTPLSLTIVACFPWVRAIRPVRSARDIPSRCTTVQHFDSPARTSTAQATLNRPQRTAIRWVVSLPVAAHREWTLHVHARSAPATRVHRASEACEWRCGGHWSPSPSPSPCSLRRRCWPCRRRTRARPPPASGRSIGGHASHGTGTAAVEVEWTVTGSAMVRHTRTRTHTHAQSRSRVEDSGAGCFRWPRGRSVRPR